MARRYNPLQARDAHGRWVAKGGNKAFNVGVKAAVGAGKKAPKFVKLTKGAKGTDNTGVTIRGVKLPIHYVPYVRINKRSQTIGHNIGTKVIPGTGGRRLVTGGYARLESTKKQTGVDRVVGKAVGKLAPPGTRRGKSVAYARKNFQVTNPAIRGSVGNAQVRLGTSRGAGPTIIVRRGKHKTAQSKSQTGVNKYNTQVGKVAGKRAATKAKAKKSRPQRRKAAAAKRKKS